MDYGDTDISSVTINDWNKFVAKLNCGSTMMLILGLTFTDPGATVTDNSGSVITPIITGTIDNTKIGKYVLNYSAFDPSGNRANSVIRNVNRIYKYSGLLAHIIPDGQNIFPLGSNIPVQFQYNATTKKYGYNLNSKTLTAGLYKLIVDLDDGMTYDNVTIYIK